MVYNQEWVMMARLRYMCINHNFLLKSMSKRCHFYYRICTFDHKSTFLWSEKDFLKISAYKVLNTVLIYILCLKNFFFGNFVVTIYVIHSKSNWKKKDYNIKDIFSAHIVIKIWPYSDFLHDIKLKCTLDCLVAVFVLVNC